jgi:hypothetical protein
MNSDKLRVNRYELTPDVETRIIDFMKRYSKEYVYCGEIAVYMHNNLAWTSWALEEMKLRGLIHELTDKEKASNDIDVRASVFSLPARK